jgi:hypothetical protein
MMALLLLLAVLAAVGGLLALLLPFHTDDEARGTYEHQRSMRALGRINHPTNHRPGRDR